MSRGVDFKFKKDSFVIAVGQIFIKDYHNIRGKTKREVATAPHINLHKVGLGK